MERVGNRRCRFFVFHIFPSLSSKPVFIWLCQHIFFLFKNTPKQVDFFNVYKIYFGPFFLSFFLSFFYTYFFHLIKYFFFHFLNSLINQNVLKHHTCCFVITIVKKYKTVLASTHRKS